MFRNALGNLQITLNFTKHDEILRTKSVVSSDRKLSLPLAIAVLMMTVLRNFATVSPLTRVTMCQCEILKHPGLEISDEK